MSETKPTPTPTPWEVETVRRPTCEDCDFTADYPEGYVAETHIVFKDTPNLARVVALVAEQHPHTEANARLIVKAVNQHDRLLEALRQIVDMKPEEFKFPADWKEQVAACAECKRYESHPIQRGICDEHRRPLWARKAFGEREEKALGYRAKTLARAAIAAAEKED